MTNIKIIHGYWNNHIQMEGVQDLKLEDSSIGSNLI